MITVALVEDDDRAARKLADFLDEYTRQYGVAFNVTRFGDATVFLSDYKPVWDIVFMDIEMPNMNGMDAAIRLRALDSSAILIFVTNMAQFAAKGYEVNALDYIIKPYVYSDFERKISRAVALCQSHGDSIVVSYRGGVQRVRVHDIRYVEVYGHSVKYHTDSGIITTSGSLSKIEESLRSYNFLRCSKPYLINPRHMVSVSGMQLTMSDGTTIPIGRTYHKSFMMALASVLGGNSMI